MSVKGEIITVFFFSLILCILGTFVHIIIFPSRQDIITDGESERNPPLLEAKLKCITRVSVHLPPLSPLPPDLPTPSAMLPVSSQLPALMPFFWRPPSFFLSDPPLQKAAAPLTHTCEAQRKEGHVKRRVLAGGVTRDTQSRHP